ncbi:hypothetical protein SDC9_108890 [bioreactor metagenome]|uniref:Uncharacterized protein n=1 Tax=bioreactor metagenome TaxID=1076179 RepID=A0A645B9B8_9ZZZZ
MIQRPYQRGNNQQVDQRKGHPGAAKAHKLVQRIIGHQIRNGEGDVVGDRDNYQITAWPEQRPLPAAAPAAVEGPKRQQHTHHQKSSHSDQSGQAQQR